MSTETNFKQKIIDLLESTKREIKNLDLEGKCCIYKMEKIKAEVIELQQNNNVDKSKINTLLRQGTYLTDQLRRLHTQLSVLGERESVLSYRLKDLEA